MLTTFLVVLRNY